MKANPNSKLTADQKAVKRFNERIRQFEKQGMTANPEYHQMKQFAERVNRKAGKTKKTPYSTIQGGQKTLSKGDMKRLHKMLDQDGYSVGHVKKTPSRFSGLEKKAKEELKKKGITRPTKSQIGEAVSRMYGDLHDTIVNNSSFLYKVADINAFIHSPNNHGKLTDAQIDRIYEVLRDDREQLLYDDLVSVAEHSPDAEKRKKARDLKERYEKTGDKSILRESEML